MSGKVPGHRPGDHLVAIDQAECMRLLQARGVGRIGVTIGGRPVIYPMNYAMDGDAIVFRTRRGSELEAATDGQVASFEIDGADSLAHEGWSVLVTGRASHVTDEETLDRLDRIPLTPWADESRDRYVRIALEEVSGRRISHRVV